MIKCEENSLELEHCKRQISALPPLQEFDRPDDLYAASVFCTCMIVAVVLTCFDGGIIDPWCLLPTQHLWHDQCVVPTTMTRLYVGVVIGL